MNTNLHNLSRGKALRRTICAALALGVTAVTTQVITHSAGQHEYGMAAMQPPPPPSSPHDTGRAIAPSIVIARSH